MQKLDLKKYNLKHEVEREYPPYLITLFSEGMYDPRRYKKFFGISKTFSVVAVNNRDYLVSQNDIDVVRKAIRKKISNDKKYLNKVVLECPSIGEPFIKWSNKIKSQDFSRASLSTLYKYINKFEEGYKNMGPFLQYVIRVEDILQEELNRIIKKKSNNPINDQLILGGADKENYDYKEIKDLLHIAVAAAKTRQWRLNPKIQKLIAKHADTYGWIATRGGSKSPPWNNKIIAQRIATYLKKNPKELLKEHVRGRQHVRRETKRLIKKYKFNKQEQNIVRLTKEFLYLRTYRTDVMGLTAFNARNLFCELAKRFSLTFWQLMMLSKEELRNLPEDVPKKRELNKRMQSFYIVILRGKTVAIHSTPLREKRLKRKKIVGNCGYRGKIHGVVKVICHLADQKKVKHGDILVAVMTFPNLIPAMERAAAFVTDEGGILCHAAIVAREMKKPCVIGTKIATKVLKDGDRVEVDAERGIVKKL